LAESGAALEPLSRLFVLPGERCYNAPVIYPQLLRFLLPLALTGLVLELGGQVLNGGMARAPGAAETLAAFGLAWGLVDLLASPLWQARQLGLVLVDGQPAFRTARRFVLLSGLFLAGIVASLALTPLGKWAIEDLHSVAGPLAATARTALLWLIPVPLLQGLALFYSGLLIRAHRTPLVSYAMFANLGASILAVLLVLPTGFVQAQPISLPVLATYAGVLSELAVVLWGCHRHTARLMTGPGPAISLGYVAQFFWPLALMMATQGLSRPLINLFVAREPGGAISLAVLTVVFALGRLPYAWLNEIRNLPPAFQDWKGSLPQIRRFAIACGLVSFGFMVLLFWTPLRDYILRTLIGLEALLAELAVVPLMLCAFFPLTVMARAYLHGVGLLQRRTQAMAPSAPARVAAIVAALVVLPAFGVHGATRGIVALLFGFTVETFVVWLGLRGSLLARIRARRFAG
jgi:hypothetical protein